MTILIFAIILNVLHAGYSDFIKAENETEAKISSNCVTPDNSIGECINLRSCQPIMKMLTKKPISFEDKEYLRRSQCGYRDEQPLVCCNNSTGKHVNKLLPHPGECGINLDDRIYGGTETQINEFPWMVLLKYSKLNARDGFHCGGTLINHRYVLTASHCIIGKDLPSTWNLTEVRLGEWDTSTEIDCDTSFVDEEICNDPPKDIKIEQKITHPCYDSESVSQPNDIALLRLAESVEYSESIRPICLPLIPVLKATSHVGQRLFVAGWGKTETKSESNIKLKVGLNGRPLEECNDAYGSQGVQLNRTQLCVGGVEGLDSCQGDSGGSLIGRRAGGKMVYWYLAGIVSFGPHPCGRENFPGVYTRVSEYIEWIEENLVE